MGYILLAVLCIAVLYMLFREKKPTETTESGKDWPYGEKLPEGKIHVKVDDVSPAAQAVTTVVENKVDPVAVALDLEPMDISGATTAKKPREPKAATPAKKPAAKKTAKKAK